MAGTKQNTITIRRQLVGWWLRDNGNVQAPVELDDSSIEHIADLLKEGYREGELCLMGADNETEFRGWWSKAKDVTILTELEYFVDGTHPNGIPNALQETGAAQGIKAMLACWKASLAFDEAPHTNLVGDIDLAIGFLQSLKTEAIKVLPPKLGGAREDAQ